jgi:sulfotransferase family protein
MTEQVWLASYPKSGNTWMRALIGALALPRGAAFDLRTSISMGGNANSRPHFEDATLLDSGLFTFDEIDRLRPRVHRFPIRDDGAASPLGARFVKVHDAYLSNADGAALLGGPEACAKAIVIVRDPRDIAPSLASHHRSSIDAAIAVMADADSQTADRPDRQVNQLRQRLSSWSGHVLSWLEQSDIEVCRVRYEDLAADPAGELLRAMAFAGIDVSGEHAASAARAANFSALQAQEARWGFAERPPRVEAFFRRGQVGGWRSELTAEQTLRIEAAHGPVMQRLGYEVTASPSASGFPDRSP